MCTHGGIELVSNTSFQTTYPSQSALVNGSSFIVAILYIPTPSHAKFNNTNKALELVKSTFPSGSSHERKALDTLRIPFTGLIIAMEVMDIEKMLRFLPDIHNMNPFIAICFPGERAIDMALLCLRALMATACLFSAADATASSLME
jgi:hypothetical protein